MEELVSVVMPTYNASRYLADSIEGVLSQTYSNLELIITDDCSSDHQTLTLLDHYAQQDKRVHVIKLSENHGAGYARNTSIRAARGRYIAFCDSDDVWKPYKLRMQISYMKAKNCALCFGSYIIIDENNKEVGYNIALPRVTFGMMKRDNKIGCSTAVYDVKRLGRKVYMPDIRKRQDWALFLTIIRKCRVAYGIRRPLILYRRHSHSVSSNKLSLVKYNVNVYELILGYNKLQAYFYFLFFFLPTYFIKVYKRKRASQLFLRKHRPKL